MKTTVDIADPLFRKAKARAAERGQSLKDFIAEALQAKLAIGGPPTALPEPSWMGGFGTLRALHAETARIEHVIEDEFETVGPEEQA